jgi:hypothetical protein
VRAAREMAADMMGEGDDPGSHAVSGGLADERDDLRPGTVIHAPKDGSAYPDAVRQAVTDTSGRVWFPAAEMSGQFRRLDARGRVHESVLWTSLLHSRGPLAIADRPQVLANNGRYVSTPQAGHLFDDFGSEACFLCGWSVASYGLGPVGECTGRFELESNGEMPADPRWPVVDKHDATWLPVVDSKHGLEGYRREVDSGTEVAVAWPWLLETCGPVERKLFDRR